jgi:hypothetical protein
VEVYGDGHDEGRGLGEPARQVDRRRAHALPARAPAGPKKSLVGHVACRGHGSGHLIWHCLACPNDELPTY